MVTSAAPELKAKLSVLGSIIPSRSPWRLRPGAVVLNARWFATSAQHVLYRGPKISARLR
jgi:hypothetical protein